MVKIDIAVILRREKKALGGNVSPPNKELTILLVIGVAGRFQLLCGSLRFFYFTFICQLQRVVNLTDQNVETVAEVFSFPGCPVICLQASAASLFAHPAPQRAF